GDGLDNVVAWFARRGDDNGRGRAGGEDALEHPLQQRPASQRQEDLAGQTARSRTRLNDDDRSHGADSSGSPCGGRSRIAPSTGAERGHVAPAPCGTRVIRPRQTAAISLAAEPFWSGSFRRRSCTSKSEWTSLPSARPTYAVEENRVIRTE